MADGTRKQHGASEPRDQREANADAPPSNDALPLHPGLPTGTGLGKYRILERIWTSHNAIIYKARDIMLDRLVTVKQMSPSLLDNPIACGHFKREAQFLARVPKDTANVATIHELIEDDSGLFIVEEYVQGHRLETLVAKRQVHPNRIVQILRAAANGLSVLHAQNVTHRDIHPGNLIVTDNWDVILSNLSSAAAEGDMTRPPTITPKYCSPELLTGNSYDDRVDIYALGITVYEACVGRAPLTKYIRSVFGVDTPSVGNWIKWHSNVDLQLPIATEMNHHIPASFSMILRKMTAKDLEDRYSSIREVCEELSRQFGIRSIEATRQSQIGFASTVQTNLALPLPPEQANALQQTQHLPVTPMTSLLSPLQQTTATTTHIVQTPGGESAPAPHTRPTVVRASPALNKLPPSQTLPPRTPTVSTPRPTHPLPPPLSHRGQLKHQPLRRPSKHHHSQPRNIPKPREVKETFKERHPHILAWTLGISLFVSVIVVGGTLGWYYRLGPGLHHPIETIYSEGLTAYRDGQLELARTRFIQASMQDVKHNRFKLIQERAEHMLPLIEAKEALARNDFENAEGGLEQASKMGINSQELSELQDQLWKRKDAIRLATNGEKRLDEGNLTAAEIALGKYKEKAEAANIDPSDLVARVEQTREDDKYRAAMQRAREALKAEEYEQALRSVQQAERSRTTTETRELRKEIEDTKKQTELILAGKAAMQEHDYEKAASAFQEAGLINPTTEIEQMTRVAHAWVLYEKADKAIEEGDLLRAEQNLRSSRWQSPLKAAETRLKKMAPAFEAARWVQRADRLIENHEIEEAIRLYNKALPALPESAAVVVRNKLTRAAGSVTSTPASTPSE